MAESRASRRLQLIAQPRVFSAQPLAFAFALFQVAPESVDFLSQLFRRGLTRGLRQRLALAHAPVMPESARQYKSDPVINYPWGYELHWARTARYVGKILHVASGRPLSLQYHHLKDETIYVLRGRLRFELGSGGRLFEGVIATRELSAGEAVHIAPKTIHRMTALEDSDVLEISTPHLDDVVRVKDDYGRADPA